MAAITASTDAPDYQFERETSIFSTLPLGCDLDEDSCAQKPSRFVDLESGEEVPVVPEGFADQYRKLMQEHISALRSKCSDARIDYVLLDTSKPLDEALFHYLGNRERVMRDAERENITVEWDLGIPDDNG